MRETLKPHLARPSCESMKARMPKPATCEPHWGESECESVMPSGAQPESHMFAANVRT